VGTYWLILRSHACLPVTKLDMTLSQQIRVLAIDLLVGYEEITRSVSRAHANIVSEIDSEISKISDIVQA
jgi:hypothetical protein